MERFSMRLHGLGGQGLKIMIQDVLAPVLAEAGFYVQAFPFFTGERRGASVGGHFRFGLKKITTHSFVDKPDMVVIFDHERIDMVKTLENLRKEGVALINTSTPHQFMGLIHDWRVYTLNARLISLARGIGEAKDPFTIINSAMAGGILHILESIIGNNFSEEAVKIALLEILPQKTAENFEAFLDGKKTVKRLAADGTPMWQWLIGNKSFPRLTQPNEQCTGCNLCYLFCPKRAIKVAADGKFIISEDKCNFCGICARICPRDAITMQTEERGVEK